MAYTPKPRTKAWLEWGLKRIQSLPYKVTARWLFYRLIDEYGLLSKIPIPDPLPKGFKNVKAYAYQRKFKPIMSRARHEYYNGWKPDTLTDDTRDMLNEYGKWWDTVDGWLCYQKYTRPRLNAEHYQDNIVYVMFEAKAMTSQFKHHLDKYRVCLVPFGGDPSIPYKWKVAKALSDDKQKHSKPIKVLYFGDYDNRGLTIPESAMRDIKAWSGIDFSKGNKEGNDYIRIGLNPEHITQFAISEDPERTGKYQWEALDEKSAEQLINKVFDYWDKDKVKDVKDTEERAGDIWSDTIKDAIEVANAEFKKSGK